MVLGYYLNGGKLHPYNILRVGGALLVGDIEYFDGRVPGLTNPFSIRASVVESREKLIEGIRRRRAIVDFGSIHTDVSATYPRIPSLKIVGYSGEYAVIDFSEGPALSVGQPLVFDLGYQAMARSMNSPRLKKNFKAFH